MGVLTVMEAILRSVFNSPTGWSFDLSTYLLIWAFFLGTAYGFQEKGHVAVDMLTNVIAKKFGERPVRVLAVISYIICLICVIVLFRGALMMFLRSVAEKRTTFATFVIQEAWLDVGMVIGAALMIVTVFFIVLDLLSGDKKYVI
jgi:C4-dicarboxylate transporter DctQ subunit